MTHCQIPNDDGGDMHGNEIISLGASGMAVVAEIADWFGRRKTQLSKPGPQDAC